ncbi:hypothetical protein FEM48_Zijuj12G0162900 [Ziziphus jujuba var. spinosa]|uniref:Uncharacterized protein n=1 Tax=Ziziphus jujuba var. spinosa TaxID=714518 RepID=A0A978UEC7_ZIZJJ|nr:hypothetical protein FEM48_Zijuj12G0162900 [Ziziphus jujuba var. spinosa]
MPILLPNLKNLVHLTVQLCEEMVEITGESSDEDEDDVNQEAVSTSCIISASLPKLSILHFHDLPELKRFCSKEIVFDSLKEICISRCPKLSFNGVQHVETDYSKHTYSVVNSRIGNDDHRSFKLREENACIINIYSDFDTKRYRRRRILSEMKKLMEAGCIPLLIKTLEAKSHSTTVIATQAISSLVTLSQDCREVRRDNKSVPNSVQLLDPSPQKTLKKNAKPTETDIPAARKLLERLERGKLRSQTPEVEKLLLASFIRK